MCCLKLSKALYISDLELISKIDLLQNKIETLPDTFFAAFWLYTHDFLYVSQSIEDVLGHSYQKFENHGMVFFQSIIPPGLISHIYENMNAQTLEIEKHPEFIFAKEYLKVDAAVFDADMNEVPVFYNAVILDVKPFKPHSFLILCSWIDKRNKDHEEIVGLSSTIRRHLWEIKELYMKNDLQHFNSIKYRNKISDREKQVALLLMQGHSTKSIGDKLEISFNTVESHRKNLLSKLESKNTAELIHKLSVIPL
jgi:DNA-binding CsgD family transcriptional regulator